jgi:hypothetical protein
VAIFRHSDPLCKSTLRLASENATLEPPSKIGLLLEEERVEPSSEERVKSSSEYTTIGSSAEYTTLEPPRKMDLVLEERLEPSSEEESTTLEPPRSQRTTAAIRVFGSQRHTTKHCPASTGERSASTATAKANVPVETVKSASTYVAEAQVFRRHFTSTCKAPKVAYTYRKASRDLRARVDASVQKYAASCDATSKDDDKVSSYGQEIRRLAASILL